VCQHLRALYCTHLLTTHTSIMHTTLHLHHIHNMPASFNILCIYSVYSAHTHAYAPAYAPASSSSAHAEHNILQHNMRTLFVHIFVYTIMAHICASHKDLPTVVSPHHFTSSLHRIVSPHHFTTLLHHNEQAHAQACTPTHEQA
jgi:hypothetical protein